METYRCDRCDKPATVHCTQFVDGKLMEGHLCALHATESGLPDPAGVSSASLFVNGIACLSPREAAETGVVSNLRGTANFIRSRGRMPASTEELQAGMALREPFPTVEIMDGELKKALDFMDGLIQCYEKHGRMPQNATEAAEMYPGLKWDEEQGE